MLFCLNSYQASSEYNRINKFREIIECRQILNISIVLDS